MQSWLDAETRGRLVIDPNGGTALVVEEGGNYYGDKTVGATSPVWWWPKFTGRRVGNEVEIVDPRLGRSCE